MSELFFRSKMVEQTCVYTRIHTLMFKSNDNIETESKMSVLSTV